MLKRSGYLITALLVACGGYSACSSDVGGSGASTSGSGGASSSDASTGSMGGGGAGGGPECMSDTQCPQASSECILPRCEAGQCTTVNAPNGTKVKDQSPGDCVEAQCFDGGIIPVNVDDPLDDMNECTVDSCADGAPMNGPAASGTPCTQAPGKVCDSGKCVECITNDDCDGDKVCQANKCVPDTCMNGQKDGSETDLDCGGAFCGDCADGKKCGAGTDCQSGVCEGTVCAPPACDDGVENGTETDVDCGGACAEKCDAGQGCDDNADCVGGSCSGTVCLPTCTDKAANGAETDVDCGGPVCDECMVGEKCVNGPDCQSGVCDGGLCAAPSCTDAVKNGMETDVDCGGPCPSKCGPGLSCKANNDCASASCDSMTLTCDSTCTDGFKGGAETDVDCGGGTCSACGVGKGCGAEADCTTGLCSGGSCQLINGCDPATAMDLTGQDPVTINFDFFFYNPQCIRVASGTKVIFMGAFASHPLAGGKIIGAMEVPDPTSPFMPVTNSGASKTFTLPSSGTFPYYCDVHSNMFGTVFVQ